METEQLRTSRQLPGDKKHAVSSAADGEMKLIDLISGELPLVGKTAIFSEAKYPVNAVQQLVDKFLELYNDEENEENIKSNFGLQHEILTLSIQSLPYAKQWAWHNWVLERSMKAAQRVHEMAEKILMLDVLPRAVIKHMLSNIFGSIETKRLAAELTADYTRAHFEIEPPPSYTRIEQSPPYRLVSAAPIKPGTEIFSEDTVAMCPVEVDKIAGSHCIHCGDAFSLIRGTLACPVMPQTCPFKFCSAECFMKNAEVHQYSCGFIHTHLFPIAEITGFTSGFVLFVCRILINTYLARKGGDSVPLSDPLVMISKMPSTYGVTARVRPELLESIQSLSKSFCSYFPLPGMLGITGSEMDDLICRIHTHGMIVHARQAAASLELVFTTGLPLFVLGSQSADMLHSCRPNVKITYDHNQLKARTLTTVLEGCPLYVDLVPSAFVPLRARKSLSASLKVIACLCKKCTDASENGTFLEGLRCPSCFFGWACPVLPTRMLATVQAINGLTMKASPVERKIIWECTECGLLEEAHSLHCEDLTISWNNRFEALNNEFKTDQQLKGTAARGSYALLYDEIALGAHPFHHLLVTLGIKLTGLFQREPSRNTAKALEYERLAECATTFIAPLLLSRTFNRTSMIDINAQTTRDLISTPLQRALWVAFCNYGPGSPEIFVVLHRLHSVSMLADRNFLLPPLRVPMKMKDLNLMTEITSQLLPSAGVPTVEHIRAIFDSDFSYWWFAACKKGRAKIVRLHFQSPEMAWLQLRDGETGLNGLGVAMLHEKMNVYKMLLPQCTLENLLVQTQGKLNIIMALTASVMYQGKDADLRSALAISDLIARVSQLVSQENQHHALDALLNKKCADFLGANSALHFAAARNKIECLKELLSYDEVIDINSSNLELSTPLHVAAYMGNVEAVNVLVSHGASIEVENARAETPLIVAAYGLSLSTVRALLSDYNANVMYTCGESGATLLHAVVAGVTKLCSLTFGWIGTKARDDNLMLHSWRDDSANYFSRDPFHCNTNYSDIPRMDALPNSTLIYPRELSERLTAAQAIVNYARVHIEEQGLDGVGLFSHSCADGFTAAELLLHQWDQMEEARQSYLKTGAGPAFASVPIADRQKILRQWVDEISLKIYHLAHVLKPFLPNEPVSLNVRTLTKFGNRSDLSTKKYEENRRIEQDERDLELATRVRRPDGPIAAEEKPLDETMTLPAAVGNIERDLLLMAMQRKKEEESKRLANSLAEAVEKAKYEQARATESQLLQVLTEKIKNMTDDKAMPPVLRSILRRNTPARKEEPDQPPARTSKDQPETGPEPAAEDGAAMTKAGMKQPKGPPPKQGVVPPKKGVVAPKKGLAPGKELPKKLSRDEGAEAGKAVPGENPPAPREKTPAAGPGEKVAATKGEKKTPAKVPPAKGASKPPVKTPVKTLLKQEGKARGMAGKEAPGKEPAKETEGKAKAVDLDTLIDQIDAVAVDVSPDAGGADWTAGPAAEVPKDEGKKKAFLLPPTLLKKAE